MQLAANRLSITVNRWNIRIQELMLS